MNSTKYFIFICSIMLSTITFAGDEIQPVSSDLPPSEELLLQDYHQGEELDMMHELITMTEKSLESQKDLAKEIKQFYTLQKSFIANRADRKLAYQFLQQASFVKKKIESAHLSHLFRDEFLEELNTLSSIGSDEEVSA